MASRLLENITDGWIFEFNKHKGEDGKFNGFESAEEYAAAQVNSMSQYELLEAISNQLEDMEWYL